MSLAQSIASNIGAYLFSILVAVMTHVPRRARLWTAARAGELFGVSARAMRTALLQNLENLLDFPPAKAEATANHVFRNFGLTLHDFFFPEGTSIDVPDREKIESVRKKHGGVLVLTFHMGNWELGARTMRQWGWPVTAVYQPYRNKRFKALIEGHRAPGVNFIPVGGRAARGVREALRRGDVVAMLGDHPFGEGGVPVDLLGHRVVWPRGPVVLAVREKTPIVIATIIRIAPQRYRAIVEEPIIPREGSLLEADRLVQEVADKFGNVVRQYSTQWYRFRPFEFASAAPAPE